jgi:hypothetical protein
MNAIRIAALACLALSTACSEEELASSCLSSAEVSVTGSGADPASVGVCRGGSVTFTNEGTTDLLLASAPHPEHTDCPELNMPEGAPLVPTGQFTATMMTVGHCGYHDHLTETPLGEIVVILPGGGGGGY